MVGEFVIVRAGGAGVHCGTLTESGGQAVVLTDSRRIWRWRGASTLNELSLHGASEEYTRISEPVDRILLLTGLEVIPCTQEAQKNLSRSRWGM